MLGPMTDPNTNHKIIHEAIENTRNKHIPSKKVKLNKYKHKMSRWITFGIIKFINHRDKMHQKLKMTDPDCQQYKMFKSNLNAYNNIF